MAHDAQRRSEGARGFVASFVLLTATLFLGAGMLTSPVQVVASGSHTTTPKQDAQVRALRHKTADQAAELRLLKALLAVQTEPSAGVPQSAGRVIVPPADSSHDDGGSGSKVVVVRQQAPAPKVVVQRPTPKPGPKPTSQPEQNTVKETTDIVKNSVKNVVDSVSEATSASARK